MVMEVFCDKLVKVEAHLGSSKAAAREVRGAGISQWMGRVFAVDVFAAASGGGRGWLCVFQKQSPSERRCVVEEEEEVW